MRILGIDPGSRVTGWGLLDSSGWDVSLLAHGALRLADEGELPPRLVALAAGLRDVLAEHRPEAVAVERVFAAKNARSALVLGHARGVALLVAAEAGLPVAEYTPMQVKSSVTGYGGADKKQVQAVLATQLKLRELPRPLDASDAIAIALCHAATARLASRLAVAEAASRSGR